MKIINIQFIQGITDEAYNSLNWVGQIEFIFRLCGLIAAYYTSKCSSKGGVTSQIYLCWYISSVRAYKVSDISSFFASKGHHYSTIGSDK